jgi:hypothetical protein
MDEQSGDELRSLRQRAYGPNADIQQDPVALERLRQLEAQTAPRPSATVEPVPEFEPEREPAWEPGSVAVTPEAAETTHDLGGEADSLADQQANRASAEAASGEQSRDAAPPEPDPSEPLASEPPRVRRRAALIWAGALTGALLVGATLSYIAVGLTPASVGVLQPDPDGEWPDDFSSRGAGSEIFEDFHGLTVVLVPQDWNGGAPSPCLFILSNASQGLIGGAGCGAGDFEPIAAITVTEQMPEALIEEFPVGSALQFQLRDGEVVVFADAP